MIDGCLSGRRILLVEDEMIIAMMVETMLEEIGCEVSAIAATPDEAIRAIERMGIDAAILDVNLDGADSFGVAARLAELDIPFLFATGYGEKGVKPPFDGRPVLSKPFRLADLRKGLRSLMAGEE